jgi:hypothetical protein
MSFSSGEDPMTPTSSDFPSDEYMSEPDESLFSNYSSPSSSFIHPDHHSYVRSLSSESTFERGEDPMTPTSNDFPSDEYMSEPDETPIGDYSTPSASPICPDDDCYVHPPLSFEFMFERDEIGEDPMTPTSSDFYDGSISEPDETPIGDYSTPSASPICPDDDCYVHPPLSFEFMFERDEIGEDPMTPTSSDFYDGSISEPDERSFLNNSSPSSRDSISSKSTGQHICKSNTSKAVEKDVGVSPAEVPL